MNNSKSTNKKLTAMCFFFAVFFLAIGVVQIVMGRKIGSNAQIIMGVVTLVYSVILFVSGGAAILRSGSADDDGQSGQQGSGAARFSRHDSESGNGRVSDQMKLEDIAAQVKDYLEYASRLESGTAAPAGAGKAVYELGVLLQNAVRLKNDYSNIAAATAHDLEKAFNSASDAYMALDAKKMALKKLTQTPGASRDDINIAQEAVSIANKKALRADDRRNALERRESKAKQLAEQAEKLAADCEALRSRIERYS